MNLSIEIRFLMFVEKFGLKNIYIYIKEATSIIASGKAHEKKN